MSFRTFFARQARKPSGLFGRIVMSRIFDYGNAILNDLMRESLALKESDHVLEIGCGTGRLMNEMARLAPRGLIEGIDLSGTMVDMATRRNKRHIAGGRVKIILGDFDRVELSDGDFDRVCSANTVYFWPDARYTVQKIHRILKPGGMLALGFEDKAKLARRALDASLFRICDENDLARLLEDVRFSDVVIVSKKTSSSIVHCVVAVK